MMQTPEAKKKSSVAKDKAWTYFIQQFPNADVSKFVSQVYVDEKITSVPKYFSRKVLVHCRVSSDQTGNIRVNE